MRGILMVNGSFSRLSGHNGVHFVFGGDVCHIFGSQGVHVVLDFLFFNSLDGFYLRYRSCSGRTFLSIKTRCSSSLLARLDESDLGSSTGLAL